MDRLAVVLLLVLAFAVGGAAALTVARIAGVL
jgi:hypothetical protein